MIIAGNTVQFTHVQDNGDKNDFLAYSSLIQNAVSTINDLCINGIIDVYVDIERKFHSSNKVIHKQMVSIDICITINHVDRTVTNYITVWFEMEMKMVTNCDCNIIANH